MFDFKNEFLWFIPIVNFPMPFVGVGIVTVWHIVLIWCIFILFWVILKNQKYYKNGFLKKNTSYNIGWPMGDWKTRLMTYFCKTIKEEVKKKIVTIISTNYLNYLSDCFFQSKSDLYKLQKDIQAISLFLNFDHEKKKEIEKLFPWYFNYDDYQEKYKNEFKKIKKLLNWRPIQFVTPVDEAHLYFFSRNHSGNFSWSMWIKLLEMFHQTRHSNQLLIMASQDTDSLDVDLRRICDKEIEVREWFWGLIFWFNLFKYLSLKYQNVAENIIFRKINKSPYLFFNWYKIYEMLHAIDNLQFKIATFWINLYNKFFKKAKLYKYHLKINENLKLPFESKFNVNINLNVYNEWDIIRRIIDILVLEEKNKEKFDK